MKEKTLKPPKGWEFRKTYQIVSLKRKDYDQYAILYTDGEISCRTKNFSSVKTPINVLRFLMKCYKLWKKDKLILEKV